MALRALLISKSVAGFYLALTFLTTLSLPIRWAGVTSSLREGSGQAFSWYPTIGLLIGLLLSGLSWFLDWVSLSAGAQAGLLLLGWVAITGGLHLDGLMDSCDAIFAPVSVERRLAIMKDVHVGAFGVIGLFFILGLKWVLLAGLIERSLLWKSLLLAPLWGRWMLVWAAQRFPYARSAGSLGGAMTAGLSARHLLIATLFSLLVQVGIGIGEPVYFAASVAPLAGLLLTRWVAGKLGGGLTGDLYGFLCEIVELLVLLSLHISPG